MKKVLGGFREGDAMRSQSSAEFVEHRKTEHDRQAVEEDEDEEYGVRKTVKKLNPREPRKRRERITRRRSCRFANGDGTTSEGGARRSAEKPRGIKRQRRCTWISCSWEMKARTGRWQCWW